TKPIQFYDLRLPALGEKAWSPNTYKARYALNIKGLPYETKWVTFQEVHTIIPEITKTGEAPTVPIIVDVEKDKVIQDSFKIAKYLEATYPQTPSLFHGNEQLHTSMQEKFVTRLARPLFCLVVFKVIKATGDEDVQSWFQKTREAKYGMPIEQFAGNPEDRIKEIHEGLKDTRKTLTETPYLTGSKVGWADVVLFSQLKMIDSIDKALLESRILDGTNGEKSLREWYERMSQYE
ncbi:hypothetical protein J3Q64DRAFT_1711330, partial [Phycomyces blakesleeanus]